MFWQASDKALLLYQSLLMNYLSEPGRIGPVGLKVRLIEIARACGPTRRGSESYLQSRIARPL